ncbi:MAG: hypothetical protein LKI34_08480 [Bifidobacterium tibiigranuli]|jgi:hypothetical protein|uniref:hypothetical protein n=1 Tax=Bifidobacterium tibiigranuli TaxID=2172043 RepID=UPI0026EE6A2D|nr:hypothetical protein [Bifidobacterium tibiigranuli]MCI1674231.1 hypothetical protein [Bifidobacterium tibiigranuli]MCI1712408.1 hypothetical protein [Bifidobacterium tibiigranuli]MCI1834377.1 hypothetical protein [Bifidobacterium tibiigranuli]
MSKSESSSSHGRLIAVVVAAALVIVLALLSAFIWPGWALNKTSVSAASPKSTEAPTTPSIKAKPLPGDASQLLKAMPDSVLNFARTEAVPSASWTGASPIEEYTLTYSTGNVAQDIRVIVAQWSGTDGAKGQYDALAAAMTGQELGTGSVKVSGNVTGSYSVKADPANAKNAVALWQNDTVVFQAVGPKDSVERFYQKFPL